MRHVLVDTGVRIKGKAWRNCQRLQIVHSAALFAGARGPCPFFFARVGRYVCREAQVTIDEFESGKRRYEPEQGGKPETPNPPNKPKPPDSQNRSEVGSYLLEMCETK